MNIERRAKYSGHKKTINKGNLKINITFDLVTLNLFASYIVSDNAHIRRSHLISMRNVLEIINTDPYQNDMERMKRYKFIKKGLEARLEANLKDPNMIIKYINGGIMDDSIIDLNNFTPMSNDELNWINNTVSETLKYSYIYNDVDAMIDICTRFKSADYNSKGAIVKEFEQLISSIQAKFRRSKAESTSEMMFSLRNDVFEDIVTDIHEQLCSPANRLYCGMQGLNEMTGGGFEAGRVYLFFGLPGEGKSATLLNLAYQIKKYNKQYKPKDPTKIPCVILLTQENTVRETVERLFNLAATPDNIINFTVDQVITLLKTEGELYLTDDSPVDIIIKYMPDNSVDTGYLYTLTEDLEDEGYEAICLIQDYIKRIRSVNHTGDIRLDLGSIINEFKTYAAIKDIPVISASQLNRDASKHIDEARKANKADLLRLLGRSNIGESMLVLENIDCGFLLAPEYDQNGKKFMGIQRIKIRYRAGNREHIYQPFAIGNDIKLLEDMYCAEPLFKETMQINPPQISMVQNNVKQSSYHTNIITDLETDVRLRVDEDDSDNFFSSRIVSSESVSNAIIYPYRYLA